MHKTQEHGILLSSQNSLRASAEEGVLSILSGITSIVKFKFNLKTVPNGTAFFFLCRNFEVILISGVAQGDGGNAETK